MHHRLTRAIAVAAASAITLLPVYPLSAQSQDSSSTTTPIKHVVVIFQENVSFDHYFGTYPHAKANNDDSKLFAGAKENTPRVNSLKARDCLPITPMESTPSALTVAMPIPATRTITMGTSNLLSTVA